MSVTSAIRTRASSSKRHTSNSKIISTIYAFPIEYRYINATDN